MAAVAGIMVALSVDEEINAARQEIDLIITPAMAYYVNVSDGGFSLVLLQTAGIG